MNDLIDVHVRFSRCPDIGLGETRDSGLHVQVSSQGLTARTLIERLRAEPGLYLSSLFGAGADVCKPAKGVFLFVNDRQVADIDAAIPAVNEGRLEMTVVRVQALPGG